VSIFGRNVFFLSTLAGAPWCSHYLRGLCPSYLPSFYLTIGFLNRFPIEEKQLSFDLKPVQFEMLPSLLCLYIQVEWQSYIMIYQNSNLSNP
jgi:hypothetical protein